MIQVTLNAEQFNHKGSHNGREYTSLQVKRTSNGRIYFTTINNGIRLSEMAKQMQLVDGEVVISFGKNDKLVIGTYVDTEAPQVIEEVKQSKKEGNNTKVRKQTKSKLENFNAEVIEILEFYGATKADEFHYTMDSDKIGKLIIKLDTTPSKIYTIYAQFEDTSKAINYFNVRPYNGKMNSHEYRPEPCLWFIDSLLYNYNRINGVDLRNQEESSNEVASTIEESKEEESNTMQTFSFKVTDDFFPQVFEGTIQANSIQEAEQMIREDYAYELDTEMDALNVTISPVDESAATIEETPEEANTMSNELTTLITDIITNYNSTNTFNKSQLSQLDELSEWVEVSTMKTITDFLYLVNQNEYNKAISYLATLIPTISAQQETSVSLETQSISNQLNSLTSEIISYYRTNNTYSPSHLNKLLQIADYTELSISKLIKDYHYIVTNIADHGGIPLIKQIRSQLAI